MTFKNRLAIISNNKWTGTRNYFEQGKRFYDEVFYLDPFELSYRFDSESGIKIYYSGEELEPISMLLISTAPRGSKRKITFLIKALHVLGYPVSDGFEKYTDYNVGKGQEMLVSSRQASANSLVFNSYESLEKFIASNSVDQMFPALYKPIFGGKGYGIKLLKTPSDALSKLKNIFNNNSNFIVLEKFMNYIREWRVYIVDTVPICSYLKEKAEGSFLANFSQGGKKLPSGSMVEVYSFLGKNLPDIYKEGIYGVDIAQCDKGFYYIIEINRCPGTTGVYDICKVDFHYEAHKILFKRARKFH